MRAPRILAIVAIASLLGPMPSFAGQRSRGGGGSASRGSGGSPPVGRAVPRGSTNPGPGHPGPGYPGSGHPGSAYPRQGYPGYGGRYYDGYGHYYGYGRYYGYPYSYGYPHYFYPGFSFSLGFGYPYGYAYPYSYGYGQPYPYGYAQPYAYGYSPEYGSAGSLAVAPGRGYGGVRIAVDQRDAQVFVDGYYVGVVDDFDEASQQVNLETGPHHIEVRHDSFEPVTFDLNVQPGRTLTYRMQLRPLAR